MNENEKLEISMQVFGTDEEEKKVVEKANKALMEVCSEHGVTFCGVVVTMTGKENKEGNKVVNIKCSPFFLIPREDMQMFIFSTLQKICKKTIKKIQRTDFKSIFTSR